MLVLNHEAYSFYHRIISIVAFNQANIVYWIVGYFKFQTILSTVSKIVTFLNLTGRQQWRNWRNTHVILPKVLDVPGFSTASASNCSYFIFSYPDHKIERASSSLNLPWFLLFPLHIHNWFDRQSIWTTLVYSKGKKSTWNDHRK